MRTILFICTGNTCRSPMAEAIARSLFDAGVLGEGSADGASDVFVASAGVAAAPGVPTSPETVDALRRLGVEFQGRSTPLSADMIRKADFVLCMTRSHAEIARDLVRDDPDAFAKIAVLDPEGDIEDPLGHGQAAYDRLAQRLMNVLRVRLQELLQP